MGSVEIHKYSHIDINNLRVSEFNIKYNSEDFLIQSPIFNDYELLNYNSKKYIELKLDNSKFSHLKFLTFIDSLELKLNNYSNNSIKTQIITNIQNKKSLKVKLLDNTTYFDSDKKEIENLYSKKKISVLFKLEFYKIYYSWTAVQILQLN